MQTRQLDWNWTTPSLEDLIGKRIHESLKEVDIDYLELLSVDYDSMKKWIRRQILVEAEVAYFKHGLQKTDMEMKEFKKRVLATYQDVFDVDAWMGKAWKIFDEREYEYDDFDKDDFDDN